MSETDGKKVVLITDAEDERLQGLAPEWLQGERAISRRVRWALGRFFDKAEREPTEAAS